MLWRDNRLSVALILAEKNNRFLFEVLPDLFPQGYLTDVEVSVWCRYYEEKQRYK